MTGDQLEPPHWVPLAVRGAAIYLTDQHLTSPHKLAILRRLALDPRMKHVWAELTRRNRQTGEYRYPANLSLNKAAMTQDEVQNEALCRLFHFAFYAAFNPPVVSKLEEGIETKREKMFQEARIVRKIADDLVATNAADPRALDDAAAMRRCADWWEAGALALRPPDDPLTIDKDRGDRAQRGAQIAIAAHLLDVFGDRLDGTAATLTAVAFGLKAASPRVSRSAFSTPKLDQKS